MNAIVDADAFIYRAAIASEEEDLFVAAARVDNMINIALDDVGAKEQVLFLSGKDNFRYKIFPEYKADRKGKERPKWEQALKQHLVDQWEAIVVDGIEADDACGIAQYGSKGDNTIIIHIDKDLNQLAGLHYNFVKKEKYEVTEDQGIYFFFYQLLAGDRIDGIKGIDGIGPKKAEKLLYGKTGKELYETVLDQYDNEEEMMMFAECLWIWRKQKDSWKDWIETS